nr:ABC transporter permease [Peristeroidobacter agariperforans]
MKTSRSLAFTLTVLLIAAFFVALVLLLPAWVLWVSVLLLALWLGITRTGWQTWSVTLVGITTIPQRMGSAAVIVVGIAGVVGVMVALFAMGKGFESTLQQTGRDDTAIILETGARSEANSSLTHEGVGMLSQLPQIRRSELNEPIASPELLVVASLPKRTGMNANIGIRGIGERGWELRPRAKLIAGRAFMPGLRELVAGAGVQGTLAVHEGATLMVNGQAWTVVGIFDSQDAHNSELWGDTAVIASAFRRGSAKTSLLVQLNEPAAIDPLNAAIANDPRLKAEAMITRQYFSRQSEHLTKVAQILGTAVGAIMAIGALFGALNSMYSAVSGRAREIATMRAIGFRRLPVVVAVMIETLLLAVPGGVIGGAIAWLLFDGYVGSTTSANSSQIVFAFNVPPELIVDGLKWAISIGLIGGLFPALQAARMQVTAGLREL